jgi:hypothetical protein
MLIRIFKSPQTVTLFAMPLLCALVVAFAFSVNSQYVIYDSSHGVLYSLLLQLPGTSFKWTCSIISFALITYQVLFFNRIISVHEVLYKPTNLPALMHLVSLSLLPSFLCFSPFLFINSLLLLAIHKTFQLYKADGALGLSFDACFIIAGITMLYSPCILFLLFFIISLSILRPFNWREWIVAAMGFITPWILLWVILFLMDKQNGVHMFDDVQHLKPLVKLKTLSRANTITAISVLSLVSLSLLKLRTNYFKNVIKMRKYQLCVLILMIVSLLIVFIPFEHSEARFSLLAVPFSVLLAYYFMALKRAFVYELLFTLIVVLFIYNYMQ